MLHWIFNGYVYYVSNKIGKMPKNARKNEHSSLYGIIKMSADHMLAIIFMQLQVEGIILQSKHSFFKDKSNLKCKSRIPSVSHQVMHYLKSHSL